MKSVILIERGSSFLGQTEEKLATNKRDCICYRKSMYLKKVSVLQCSTAFEFQSNWQNRCLGRVEGWDY